MQNQLEIKPQRLNYLLFMFAVTLLVGIGGALVGIVVFRDGFPEIIGSLLGVLLVWAYDESTQYKGWKIKLTNTTLVVPERWLMVGRNSLPLAELDATRTLIYNSENNFHNRIRYTFWSKNGHSLAVAKYLYGQSQVKVLVDALFKKIQNLKAKEPAH